MKILITFFFLLFISFPLSAQPYQIGDFVEGGIVFQLDESGEHGLVCARHDQTFLENWETSKTRCESYFGISNGQMVRGWRLPTKEEVAIMRLKKDLISKVSLENGGEALDDGIAAYYWSSTEDGDSHAWIQAFGFGNPSLMGKNSTVVHSRAVREF